MIDFEKATLSNGLETIVHTDRSTPLATVNILYKTGARDEYPEKTGFAHLFEHLMFGGSVNIPSYDEPLQKAGGENNAFTSNDITNYYLTLPSENLETGLWLESDRMLELDFSQRSLDIQKNVVIEEYRQRYLNQPYGDVWLLLRPLAFKTHPYKWPAIGKDISHIENATLEDVKQFFYTHYAPNNAVMVIAGNVEPEETFRLAEKWFGPIKRRDVPERNLPAEEEQKEARRLAVERDVPSSAIYMAYHMCERTATNFYSADLLSDILANGKSSRLYQRLVKERKLFSEINAYLTGDLDPGLFVVKGMVKNSTGMEEAETAIREELDKLAASTVEVKELEKVKNRIESREAFTRSNILNKAIDLAYYEFMGDASMINGEIEKYRSRTPEELRNYAAKLFTENNCSVLCYLSSKKE